MKIGIISDTHDHFDPRLPELFRGVDHILHAGDIGPYTLLRQLEAIAPVTAVLGNNDLGLPLEVCQVLELGRKKFLLQHIVNPRALSDALTRRLAREQPDVVVFGHSHRAFAESYGPTLFLNPGYAGRPRFGQPRSIALLHGEDRGWRHEFIPL